MPAPLWQDALEDLRRTGAPVTEFNLNNAMNFLAANPQYRPSYMQDGGMGGDAQIAAGLGAVPSDYLPEVRATELAPPATAPVPQRVNPRGSRPVPSSAPIPQSKPTAVAQRPTTGVTGDWNEPSAPGTAVAAPNSTPSPDTADSSGGYEWLDEIITGVLTGLGAAYGARQLGRGSQPSGISPPNSVAGHTVTQGPATNPGPGVTRMQSQELGPEDVSVGMRVPNGGRALPPPVGTIPSPVPQIPSPTTAVAPVGRPITVTPDMIIPPVPNAKALPPPQPKPRQKPDPRSSKAKNYRAKRTAQ